MSKATEIIKEVEKELLEKLKEGKNLWNIPYILEDFYNNFTEKRYNGINQYLLAKSMKENNFKSTKWSTFKQLQDKGLKLKKGSHSTQIVFFSVIDKGKDEEPLKFWKYYNIFNLSQTEDYKDEQQDTNKLDNLDSLQNLKNIAQNYINKQKLKIEYNNSLIPNYNKTKDIVTVPTVDHFKTSKGFISTLLHELAHSTGAKNRLNRDLSMYSLSNNEKSQEELLAELTATLFLKKNGLEVSNNYEYIKSWYKYINTNKIKITSILNKSFRIYKYILEK